MKTEKILGTSYALEEHDPKVVKGIFRQLRREYNGSTHGKKFLDDIERDEPVAFYKPPAAFLDDKTYRLSYFMGNIIGPATCPADEMQHELRHHWQSTGPRYVLDAGLTNAANPRQYLTLYTIHEGDALNVMETFKPKYKDYTCDDFHNIFLQMTEWHASNQYMSHLFPLCRKAIAYPFECRKWAQIEDRLDCTIDKILPDNLKHVDPKDVDFTHLALSHVTCLPDGRNYMFDGLTPQEQWHRATKVSTIIEQHYGSFFKSISECRAANLRLPFNPTPP
jgi:hypothetical protein